MYFLFGNEFGNKIQNEIHIKPYNPEYPNISVIKINKFNNFSNSNAVKGWLLKLYISNYINDKPLEDFNLIVSNYGINSNLISYISNKSNIHYSKSNIHYSVDTTVQKKNKKKNKTYTLPSM